MDNWEKTFIERFGMSEFKDLEFIKHGTPTEAIIDFIKSEKQKSYNDGVYDCAMRRGFNSNFVSKESGELSVKMDEEFECRAKLEALDTVLTKEEGDVILAEDVHKLISKLEKKLK